MTGDWSSTPRGTLIRSLCEPQGPAHQQAEENRQPEEADDALPVGRGEAFLLLRREAILDHHEGYSRGKDDRHPLVHGVHGRAPCEAKRAVYRTWSEAKRGGGRVRLTAARSLAVPGALQGRIPPARQERP